MACFFCYLHRDSDRLEIGWIASVLDEKVRRINTHSVLLSINPTNCLGVCGDAGSIRHGHTVSPTTLMVLSLLPFILSVLSSTKASTYRDKRKIKIVDTTGLEDTSVSTDREPALLRVKTAKAMNFVFDRIVR